MQRFAREYKAAYPKAVDCLLTDQEHLLTFFDFPAEHWVHLRTTNPIESPFATVKARTQDQGSGIAQGGTGPGLQVGYCCGEALAQGTRAPLGGPGACGGDVSRWPYGDQLD
jgi:hypothetical protein